MNKQETDTSKGKRAGWFLALLLIGLGICLPKLLRPIRADKQGYRDAANWLRDNTTSKDIIAVPDLRVSFYAERKGLICNSERIPKRAKYVVKIVKNENQEPKFDRPAQEQYSVWLDRRKKSGRKLVIYRMM